MEYNIATTEIYIDTVSGKKLRREFYYFDGKLYKECYYLNGYYHREDGPSVIEYEDNAITEKYHYLNGKETMDYLQKEKINNEKIIEEHKEENKNIKQTKKRRIFIIEE